MQMWLSWIYHILFFKRLSNKLDPYLCKKLSDLIGLSLKVDSILKIEIGIFAHFQVASVIRVPIDFPDDLGVVRPKGQSPRKMR
jgi:hypothetical protein